MVAARHGLDSDLPTLRRRFSVSLKGATLADLVRVAGQLQLNPRALRAELEHLPQLAAALHPALGPEPLRRAEGGRRAAAR